MIVASLFVLAPLLSVPLDEVPWPPAPADTTRAFFETQCASCHGPRGQGDGPMANLLRPPPRDFGSARFHIVSAENRLPTDQDLLDTIRLGVAGTAMPAWSHLPRELQADLVRLVRTFMLEAAAERRERGETPEQARARVATELAPNAPPNLGAAPPVTPEFLERGRVLYAESCVECHDVDGRGLRGRDLTDAHGEPSPSRDFTRGLLRGGTDPLQLARRIRLGLPGTAMPAFELPEDDVWALAHHVSNLVPPGAQQRLLPTRREVAALRVRGELAELPTDWASVPQSFLPLLPYRWDEPLAEGLDVQAIHDGARLAIRARWTPARPDQDVHWRLSVSLTPGAEPALFEQRASVDEHIVWDWPRVSTQDPVVSDGGTTDGGWQVVFLGQLDPALIAAGEMRLQLRLRAAGTRAFTVWNTLQLGP